VALIKIIIAIALGSLVGFATALDSLVGLIMIIFTRRSNNWNNHSGFDALALQEEFLMKAKPASFVNAPFHFASMSLEEKLYLKLKKPIWINMKFTTQTFSFFRNQKPYPQEPYPPAHCYKNPLSPDWLLQISE